MIEIQKEIDKEWKEIFKNSKHKWKIPIYENSIKKINRRINPMKAQEKIVLFKRFKSELINKAMVEEGITYPDNIAPYYLPIDDNPFITMDDKKAQEVWNELLSL